MSNRKGITVLGSTGTIGVNTLDVLSRHPDKYRVVGLTANTGVDNLYQQCVDYQPEYAAMADADSAEQLELIVNDAQTLLENLRKNGHEIPHAWERFQQIKQAVNSSATGENENYVNG